MNLKELAKNIRNKKHPNSFYYKNKYYVLDYYDMDGFYMTYGSKQAKKEIVIRTPNNRYKDNYKNMNITLEDKACYNLYVNYED